MSAPLCLAHSDSLNIEGRSAALLARPDVVQLPEDVYILHTCACHPQRCSAGVNDILKWQWAHRETAAARCWSICGSAGFCCLLGRAENSSAFSHLGKQLIAVSIIYSNIQRWQPQTILTRRLTEMNASAPPSTNSPVSYLIVQLLK